MSDLFDKIPHPEKANFKFHVDESLLVSSEHDLLRELIDHQMEEATRSIIDQKEAYLLKFFGSYENAQALAHEYVFEEHDNETTQTFDEYSDQIKYVVTSTFRLRRKTDEEKADEAERAEIAKEIEAYKYRQMVAFVEETNELAEQGDEVAQDHKDLYNM